ncbi:esterase/lipase family protein [Actinoplanes sp. RD1]|uniref:esterase/lipase family protein n=1 Tax=Actinoplanes sp. RD1 TaxID=3064538 RepID=UPI002742569E|nr:alpha/beta hydrolase [Actinoplanes sp. RD1]
MERLPIIYIRGFAGATAGIDEQVDDPFYGFNAGSTHIRINGDGEPDFYQFEGPMLRLLADEDYHLLVRGDQRAYLADAGPGEVESASIWVYRFYDQAATTFARPPHEGLPERLFGWLRKRVTAEGFDIETAAAGLYDLVTLVREKTGAPKVHLVAHSMGGLVARCMLQKLCGRDGRAPAPAVVSKLFTYGTPHGGIDFDVGALDWVQKNFGPAGSDIFAPEKMYGYLTPGRRFGDEPRRGADWDPRSMQGALPPEDVFCLVGTNPDDYGIARAAVGPKSDGLVRIENAYVPGAHRAYVHRSHSGRYGEVNSEEGYQNLRRFLFGRWAVAAILDGLPRYPRDMDRLPAGERWPVWQADMRLAVRGVPVIMSEQLAAHWCPIQINEELRRHIDGPDTPVPLVRTFLLDRVRMRYTLTLRVFKLTQARGSIRYSGHLEQVPDWADSLIVDVEPHDGGDGGLRAWAAWNSEVAGEIDKFDPITEGVVATAPAERREPLALREKGQARYCEVSLPDVAKALPILGPDAVLRLEIAER